MNHLLTMHEAYQRARAMRPIPGFHGYLASEDGAIHSYKKRYNAPAEVQSYINRKSGYPMVQIHRRRGKRVSQFVHRLVLTAFAGPAPFEGAQTCHNNGIKTDNRIANLRWGTAKDNFDDSLRHGSRKYTLDPEQAAAIYQRGQAGDSQTALGREFNISNKHVNNIVRGRRWVRAMGAGSISGTVQGETDSPSRINSHGLK